MCREPLARGLLAALDLLRDAVGHRQLLALVVAPEHHRDHVRPHVTADDRPDAALQKQDAVVALAQRLLQAGGVLRAVGVADDHAATRPRVGLALVVVLGQLLDALLAPARHARQRQLAVDGDSEQRLHVQLRARVRHRAGDAAAAAQGLQIVHHELGVHEVARLLGPARKLLRRHAVVALAQRLVHQQRLGHRGQARVHDVQLGVRMFGHQLVVHERRCIEAAGQPAGEAQVHGGHPARDGALERVAEHGHGHLRGGRLLAVAHRLVEIVRRRGLVQIVGMLAVAHDVGEPDKLDAFPVDDLERQVAARIDDEVALMLHERFSLSERFAYGIGRSRDSTKRRRAPAPGR